MKLAFALSCALTALLGSLILQGQSESGSQQCREDCIPGIQGECGRPMYRGEYRNPEREYQLRLTDGVVAYGGCGSGPGDGVGIYLGNPADLKIVGGIPWDGIGVSGHKGTTTPKEEADRFAREMKESIVQHHDSDLEILPATAISFGSLDWIDVKASLIHQRSGKLLYEVMFAKNPREDVYYVIGFICSAVLCEKERPVFNSVVGGFAYVPASAARNQ